MNPSQEVVMHMTANCCSWVELCVQNREPNGMLPVWRLLLRFRGRRKKLRFALRVKRGKGVPILNKSSPTLQVNINDHLTAVGKLWNLELMWVLTDKNHSPAYPWRSSIPLVDPSRTVHDPHTHTGNPRLIRNSPRNEAQNVQMWLSYMDVLPENPDPWSAVGIEGFSWGLGGRACTSTSGFPTFTLLWRSHSSSRSRSYTNLTPRCCVTASYARLLSRTLDDEFGQKKKNSHCWAVQADASYIHL